MIREKLVERSISHSLDTREVAVTAIPKNVDSFSYSLYLLLLINSFGDFS